MQAMPTQAPQNKLHLTPDQQKKFQALFMQAALQQNAILQNKSLTEAQKRTKLIALRTTLQGQEKALMTPAQLTLINQHEGIQAKYYKAIVALGMQMEQQRKALLASLTPTQKAQAMAVDQQVRSLALKLQTDKTMTLDQKTKQYHDATDVANAKLIKIYTPAQMAGITQLNNNERELQSLKSLYMDAGL